MTDVRLSTKTLDTWSITTDDANIMGIDDSDLSHDYVMYGYQGDTFGDTVDFSWLNKSVTPDYDGGSVTTDNTVVFDANGGYFGNASVTEQEVTGTVGQTYNIPADPVRDGYTFLGWTLEGAPVFEGETTFEMPADTGVEYVANWIKQVTIHFDNTGDSTVNDITADSGATWTDAEKPDDPEKAGYKFMGWEGEGAVDGELPANYPTASPM